MKKVLFSLLIPISVFLLGPKAVFAQNKLGVNIAARRDEFDQAAKLVGAGGWVVVMASPGDAAELNKILATHSEVNIILRGHCPSDPLGPDNEVNRKFALTWAATLGAIDTAGRRIYFMPWNEPNMTRECGGAGDDFDATNTECAPYVVEYVRNLRRYFNDAGLLDKKVALISPMVNQHHANYAAFIHALGGRSFFGQFSGVTMNLYNNENCAEARCHADRYHEVLASVGLDGLSVFAAELGVIAPSGSCGAGVSDCPVFEDFRMRELIESSYPTWRGDSDFVMFSPLSYNPEVNASSWIWGSSTADFYAAQPKGGGPPSDGGFGLGGFLDWRDNQGVSECTGMTGTFAPSPDFCVACGAAIYGCQIPLTRDLYNQCPKEDTLKQRDSWHGFWSDLFSGLKKLLGFNDTFSVSKLTVPIEGQLEYLFGGYPAGGGEFAYGPIFNLAPPDAAKELQQKIPQYLGSFGDAKIKMWTEDDGLSLLEKIAIKFGTRFGVIVGDPEDPAKQLINLALPQVFGLWKTAEGEASDPSLFNFLSRLPGEDLEPLPYAYLNPEIRPVSNVRLAAVEVSSAPAVLGALTGTCEFPRTVPELETDCFQTRELPVYGEKEVEVDKDDCDKSTQNGVEYGQCSLEAGVDSRLELQTTFIPEYTRGIINTLFNFVPPSEEIDSQAGIGHVEWSYGSQDVETEIWYKDLGTVQNLIDYVQEAVTPPSWK